MRGDDLLSSTPRQVLLQRLLGLPTPQYVHVPLVVGADGQRLAKRHGAVTLADLAAEGVSPADGARCASPRRSACRLGEHVGPWQLSTRFDLAPPRGRVARSPLADLQRSWA